MNRPHLPNFTSPSTEELRAFWAAAGSPQLDKECQRRIIAEVVRLRALVAELDAYGNVVQRVWSEEHHSTLVALEKMRILFSDERSRLAGPGRPPPLAPPDGVPVKVR